MNLLAGRFGRLSVIKPIIRSDTKLSPMVEQLLASFTRASSPSLNLGGHEENYFKCRSFEGRGGGDEFAIHAIRLVGYRVSRNGSHDESH